MSVLTVLVGLPMAMLLAGTSFVTTEHAAIAEISPILTPFCIRTSEVIQHLRPMRIGLWSECIHEGTSLLYDVVRIYSQYSGLMEWLLLFTMVTMKLLRAFAVFTFLYFKLFINKLWSWFTAFHPPDFCPTYILRRRPHVALSTDRGCPVPQISCEPRRQCRCRTSVRAVC